MDCVFDLSTCSNLNEKLHSAELCIHCKDGNNYEHIDNFTTLLPTFDNTTIDNMETLEENENEL